MRVVVGDTISVELAVKLGFKGILISSGKRAIYDALCRAEELALLRSKEALGQIRLKAILDSVTEGIIATDNNGNITQFNPVVEKYFGFGKVNFIGKPLSALLPDFNKNEELISIACQQYLINVQQISHKRGQGDGDIITLKPLKQIQDIETRLRKKLHTRGLVAKHSFEDIIGESDKIKETIYKARKISKSNATVLITGGTGTGKEMFAQGMHN